MKLKRKGKRYNPSAKMMKGRVSIRDDFKQMLEAEAAVWNMKQNRYLERIFEHFFCELNPLERYNALNPSHFSIKDYEDE